MPAPFKHFQLAVAVAVIAAIALGVTDASLLAQRAFGHPLVFSLLSLLVCVLLVVFFFLKPRA